MEASIASLARTARPWRPLFAQTLSLAAAWDGTRPAGAAAMGARAMTAKGSPGRSTSLRLTPNTPTETPQSVGEIKNEPEARVEIPVDGRSRERDNFI